LIKKIANMLADGKIIGWHQGRGEIGPRALGNRSILMNPTIKNGKNILNEKVKHREPWRPYAASVLSELANEWFYIEEDSPYMMRAVKVREEKANLVPAIVHCDRTCRIQTVSKLNNELFYSLINEFYKITNIPLLLNTSLNVAGKPIVGCASDSLEIFKNSELDAIVIGKILCKSQ
jgi:carbamoyltransferase